MRIDAPQIYKTAVKDLSENLLPIFFIDISYNILKSRGKTVNRSPQVAKMRVYKGLSGDFSGSKTKRDALKDYFGYDRDKSQYKKVKDFDLSKIEITGINLRSLVGYGIK